MAAAVLPDALCKEPRAEGRPPCRSHESSWYWYQSPPVDRYQYHLESGGERVRLAGECGQSSSDVVDGGFDVGHGGVLGVSFVEVAGVGVGDGESEVAFDPGEGGVPDPVGGHVQGGDPGQVAAEADPEVVV